MNWEKSRAITPLKKDFLTEFFKLERNFYLTGGSALGIFYLDHRQSFDLDLFSTSPVDWHSLSAVFTDCAATIQAEWKGIASSPYFHRFELTRGNDREVIDFVVEKVVQLNPLKPEVGSIRIDTLLNIGVNKMCTILSRSEIKDIIDLYFLERAGFKAIEHIDDARKKDAGFDPATLSHLLSSVTIRELPYYLLDPLTPEELQAFVGKLQRQMALEAFPEK